MEATYKQKNKEKSRCLVWEHAVYSLTHNRINTRILQPEYLRKLWDYSINECVIKYGYSSNCDKSIFTDWQSYSDIIYGNKNANELRVAFFCGPEPENDVKHLLDLGVRIENTYAFEYDNTVFRQAVNSLHSSFPNLKIFNGKIDSFSELKNITFDIIYLDFTKSLISEFKTACKLFDNNILTEQSILAINTTYPDCTEENITFLAEYFLFQSCFEYGVLKGRNDSNDEDDSGLGQFVESCFAYGYYSVDDLKPKIKDNFEEAYSAFQTHFIISYSSQIKPITSVVNNSILRKRVFHMDDKTLLKQAQIFADQITILFEPENYSFMLFSSIVSNPRWNAFFNLKNHGLKFSHADSIRLMELYRNADSKEFIEMLSDALKKELPLINDNLIGAKSGLFCDVPMIHLWLELIINQLGTPYHHNTKNHRRYSYTAKSRKMCLDIFTFDKCRSLYDWLPMIEYYGHDLSVTERQIITRMCIDAINKHSLWILCNQYFGSALIGINERPWSENHWFTQREEID